MGRSIKQKAWDMFSKYIRLRDCLKTTHRKDIGMCITCGKVYPIKKLQAGHFIAGRHNAVLFDEKGVNAQCFRCNYHKHGEPLLYRQRLVNMYGEKEVELLEAKRWVTRTIKKLEYEAIYHYYKKEYEKLEAK